MHMLTVIEEQEVKRRGIYDGIDRLKSIIKTTSESENLSAFEVARLDGMKVALSIVTGDKHEDRNQEE